MELQKTSLVDEAFFSELREKEFNRLNSNRQIYLDYAGCNLYPSGIIDAHTKLLKRCVYGNPHSVNIASQLSEKHIARARQYVLNYFNAPDYTCIFTANATASLQIIGECYPFSEKSHLLLTADNHNSVNGIREYCRNKGGSFSYTPLNKEEFTINAESLYWELNDYPNCRHKLFAFPAQSNATGIKHSLSWIQEAQERSWDVLLDASAFVPSSKLDLSAVKPDFVCLSFYKIFGYPAGIGCLLIKNSKFRKLQKPWFAGGNVSIVSINHIGHFLTSDHQQFENGTVNYLGIPAVTMGLKFIEQIGIDRISRRTKALAGFLINELRDITHPSGEPVVKIFGSHDMHQRGGTMMMNFYDRHGQPFSLEFISKLANERKIAVRTGCFCNPGVDEANNCISGDELQRYFASRNTGDYNDMVQFLGRMRGAVRVSVGIPTIISDLETFIDFAKSLPREAGDINRRLTQKTDVK